MVSDDENVLKKVITGDESWFYGYYPETKQQSSQWKRADEPRLKKARQSQSHVKSTLIIFFDCEGVVHKNVQLRQPPYSPDIAPCDFWMFQKLKMALKGKRFEDIDTIQSNATCELKAIPKSAFEDCFKMWKHRWERVVQSNGDYFKGCHGTDDEE